MIEQLTVDGNILDQSLGRLREKKIEKDGSEEDVGGVPRREATSPTLPSLAQRDFVIEYIYFNLRRVFYMEALTTRFGCAATTRVMLDWICFCAGFSMIPRFLRTSTFLIGTVAIIATVMTGTVGIIVQLSSTRAR
jgi:hypothetical protein